MNITLGIIGGGNMSSAISNGIIKNKLLKPENMYISDIETTKLEKMAAIGVHATSDNNELVKKCDVIIIAVKPNICPVVLKALSGLDCLGEKLFISIAAGVTIESIKTWLGIDAKVIRTMPNTPALVGEAMTVLSMAEPVTNDELKMAGDIFNSFGKTVIMEEKLMSAVVAVNGSSPAYVFIMLEAMADAAVKSGIARDVAYKLAAQSVLGSAKMLMETAMHPGELKDMVCSPAGTTIEAVEALEEYGFRNAILKAMDACTKRSYELGNKK